MYADRDMKGVCVCAVGDVLGVCYVCVCVRAQTGMFWVCECRRGCAGCVCVSADGDVLGVCVVYVCSVCYICV